VNSLRPKVVTPCLTQSHSGSLRVTQSHSGSLSLTQGHSGSLSLTQGHSRYFVQRLCTVQCPHIWTDLTGLWIGFCLTGPISLCLESFLCMYCMHVWACNTVRWTWWDWSLSLGLLLPSVLSDTVGWVIWPVKPVPDMTYNVFSRTLNSTQSYTNFP